MNICLKSYGNRAANISQFATTRPRQAGYAVPLRPDSKLLRGAWHHLHPDSTGESTQNRVAQRCTI
jgi:hypothetical protein